jgi:hypothetical protein
MVAYLLYELLHTYVLGSDGLLQLPDLQGSLQQQQQHNNQHVGNTRG